MKLKYTFLVLSAVAFASCKPKLEAGTPEKGNVDATRYVAIGGSPTAGFADGALYYEGQENAYPNILAKQFELIGGGEFRMPWMPANSVGIGFTGKSKSVLGSRTDCTGAVSLGPIAFNAGGGDISALSANIYSTAFNNMGVPGATSMSVHLQGYGNPANGAGNYNPFFYRMASNPASSSMISDAVNANPTFFSISLGEQDILNNAMSGGTVSAIPAPLFEGSMTTTVTALNANGARGVITNIPDVTLYPYFNTIPWNGLALNQGKADTLNIFFGNGAVGINFHAGNNAFVIQDANAPNGYRQMTKNEKVLLSVPLDSVKCYKWGSLVPLPNKYVLTEAEISDVQGSISAYNQVISNLAGTYGLAMADVNTFMKSVKTGIVFNGIGMSATFVSGGTFSLDGIHLNPIGQAMIANVLIKSINTSFGSTIPQVDATKYRGVKFP